MSKDFLLDPLAWDYGELSKLANRCGGPQKAINIIYNAGRIDTLKAVAAAAIIGTTVFVGVKNRLSSKRKKDLEKLISEQEIDKKAADC